MTGFKPSRRRTICPVCETTHALLADGRIQAHWPGSQLCDGAYQRPTGTPSRLTVDGLLAELAEGAWSCV
jgi:hypothetical protein